MRFLVVLLLLFGATAQGFVGGDLLFDLGRGARTLGMAGSGIALPSPDALFLNPAGLPWVVGFHVHSTYADLFGAATLGALGVTAPGVGFGGILLDAGALGPGLGFRTAGALLGAGVRLGPVGIGARARLLRPLLPVPGVGGALDMGLLLHGPVQIGLVVRNALARSPVAPESWPVEGAVGVALPLAWGPWQITVAADVLGIGSLLSAAVGAEVGVQGLLVRVGYGPGGLTLGGGIAWRAFTLDWAVLLPPVLPPAFRVSLDLRL